LFKHLRVDLYKVTFIQRWINKNGRISLPGDSRDHRPLLITFNCRPLSAAHILTRKSQAVRFVTEGFLRIVLHNPIQMHKLLIFFHHLPTFKLQIDPLCMTILIMSKVRPLCLSVRVIIARAAIASRIYPVPKSFPSSRKCSRMIQRKEWFLD